jgi:hypothetical protein
MVYAVAEWLHRVATLSTKVSTEVLRVCMCMVITAQLQGALECSWVRVDFAELARPSIGRHIWWQRDSPSSQARIMVRAPSGDTEKVNLLVISKQDWLYLVAQLDCKSWQIYLIYPGKTRCKGENCC